MKKALAILTLLLISFQGVTQISKDEIIQQRIEFISEQLETENLDLTDVVVQLEFYYDHPLNLNSANKEQLNELWLLSEIQINDLLLHRKLYGKFISVYELQSLQYWDMATIRMVLPFIRIDDKLDQMHVGLNEAFKEGKFEAYFRYQTILEDKSGYDDVPDSILDNSNQYYRGNADRYYSRLRFSYRNNLSIGVTAEKDPGEEFFRGSQQNTGFDFYSGHAYYQGGKYLKAVAIGDYQVQIGQGLNLWSGYAFGKTADVTNVKRTARSLKPYTSVDETRFLRGAAFELGVGKFAWTNFASIKNVDATVIADTLIEEQEFVSSINLTGFHRTNSEIARKDALTEMMYGSNLRYQSRNFSAGVAAVYQGYNVDFIRDTLPYNQFDFRGRNTLGLSADYSWVVKNFNFFGEVAHTTHSGAFANLHGVLASIDKRISMALIYRNYDRAFQTFYNNGFSEASRTQNEEGLYAGLKINFTRKFSLNTYADFFRFPWLRFQVDAPSTGHEFLIQPAYKASRSLIIYGRFRQQIRQRNSRDTDGTVTGIEDVLQRNYRIDFNYKISEDFRLKSRIEYVTINRPSNQPEDGVILTQDILYKPKSSNLDVALRYALFDTDSYDTRIYTYENNALYVFAVPAYFYQGSRGYILLRYTFLRRFDVWARYGVSIFANRNSIGTGPEEIQGTTRSDVTVQLRMKL
ncbi:helix-hairpin-helix domain-containing protein [bacterium]|nr:helix-hairpin-helix domain-containing protein [bacterium]MDB2656718.1 helix-hairpin-helix domain-containing protein [Crocinitomicaceae bacterium]MDB3906885.1 helix-hairpin-helix domain-containing protein [Crocinitomicaceae bacterium]